MTKSPPPPPATHKKRAMSVAATRVKSHAIKQARKKENISPQGGQKDKRSTYLRSKIIGKPHQRRRVLVDVHVGVTQAEAKDDTLRALARFGEAPSASAGLADDDGAEKLIKCVRRMEGLVEGFKGKVDDLSKEFEAVRTEIDDQLLRFHGLEQDYAMALECVSEETATRQKFEGWLANAERQIDLLHTVIPEEHRDIDGAFSQARVY